MKNNILIVAFITIIIGGAGGFFGGMQYQKSQNPRSGNQMGNRMFGGMRGMNGGSVTGEILSSDDKSITVKLTDGSSKIVLVSTNTQINKSANGTKDDLKTGEKVAVFGSTNSDGSVTAMSVQLNPMFRGTFPGATSSPSAK